MATVEIIRADGGSVRIDLTKSQTSFGSNATNDVRLFVPVDGHCEFIVEQRPNGYWLRDLGSRPPVSLLGASVQEQQVFDGDEWESGETTFRLRLGPATATKPMTPPRREPASPPNGKTIRSATPAARMSDQPAGSEKRPGSSNRFRIWLCAAVVVAAGGAALTYYVKNRTVRTQAALESQRIENLLANAPARIDSLVDELRVGEAESLIETLREEGVPRRQCGELTDMLTDAARDRYDALLDEAADNLARNDLRLAETALERADRLRGFVTNRSRYFRLTGELADQQTRVSVDTSLAALERGKPEATSVESAAISPIGVGATDSLRVDGGRSGAAVRFVVSPPTAIIRMDSAGTAESGQTVSGLPDGSIRFVAEARGYMTLSGSAPVSNRSLTVISVTLCPQPPDFLWVLHLLSGTPAQALAARYYETEHVTDRWKEEFRQLAARRGRAVRRDIARFELDNGDVLVAVIERRNSAHLELRLLDGTTRRVPRAQIKDERLATSQEVRQAGLEPACAAFLKATDRVEAAFANLAAFVQDCPDSVDVVLEKCGTRIGNVLGKLELACASCRGTREAICGACRGVGKRVELRTCSACEDGKKSCFRCKGSGVVNCSKCGGRGTLDESVIVYPTRGWVHNETILVPCNACEMTGTMTCTACGGRKDISCQICRGSGKVEKHGACSVCGGTSRVHCPDCNGDGSRAAMNPAKREAIERSMARCDDCHVSVTISNGE